MQTYTGAQRQNLGTCRSPPLKDDEGVMARSVYLLAQDSYNNELEDFRDDDTNLVCPPLCDSCAKTS